VQEHNPTSFISRTWSRIYKVDAVVALLLHASAEFTECFGSIEHRPVFYGFDIPNTRAPLLRRGQNLNELVSHRTK